MKRKVARTINVILCLTFVIMIMRLVYKEWSQYGDYTMFSFFASLLIHGGFGFFMGYVIDEAICKYFDKNL